MDYKKQTGEVWTDSQGNPIPVYRISKSERISEQKAVIFLNKALDIQRRLDSLVEEMELNTNEVYKMIHLEKNVIEGDLKNFVWYNFDKTIKIERQAHMKIKWDETTMLLAKESFEGFINNTLKADGEGVQILRKIIMSAFQNRKGQFDNRRVNMLLSYQMDPLLMSDESFAKAIELLGKARIERGEVIYFRIYVLKGDYKPLNLVLSKVDPDGEPKTTEEQ